MTPILQGTDLRLRPLQLPEDVAFAVPWYHDPEVLRNSEGEGTAPYDAEQVAAMYRYLQAQGEVYLIEVATPDGLWRPIGDATLAPHTLPIVIGDAAYRGKGLGRRVIALLIDRARSLGWAELQVKQIFTYNLRSRRMFEAVGFQLVGEGVDEEGRGIWRLGLIL